MYDYTLAELDEAFDDDACGRSWYLPHCTRMQAGLGVQYDIVRDKFVLSFELSDNDSTFDGAQFVDLFLRLLGHPPSHACLPPCEQRTLAASMRNWLRSGSCATPRGDAPGRL